MIKKILKNKIIFRAIIIIKQVKYQIAMEFRIEIDGRKTDFGEK